MPSSVLVTKNLTKNFKSNFLIKTIKTLKGIDLDVLKGETYGFIGHNGAGKTTTIKILTGLITQTSGKASVMGYPVDDVRSRSQIGFLPERPYFYEFLTARETLKFYGSLNHMTKDNINSKIKDLLSLLELEEAADRPIGGYSKGMLQRLGMAQALIHDPHLIILDEPMSGLDPLGRNKIKEIIKKLKSLGKTVFFSTHILSDVEQLCDKIALIGKGKIRYSGTVNDLTKKYQQGTRIKFNSLSENEQEFISKLPGEFTTSENENDLFIPGDKDNREILGQLLKENIKVKEMIAVKSSLEEIFVREFENMED